MLSLHRQNADGVDELTSDDGDGIIFGKAFGCYYKRPSWTC
jgi:hypothetical protein